MSKLVRTCLWHTKRWCLLGLVASQSKIVRKQINESTLLSELWTRIAIDFKSQVSANLKPKTVQRTELSWATTQLTTLNSQLSFDSQHIYGIGPGKEGKVNPGQNLWDLILRRSRTPPGWSLNYRILAGPWPWLISLVSRVLPSLEFT